MKSEDLPLADFPKQSPVCVLSPCGQKLLAEFKFHRTSFDQQSTV